MDRIEEILETEIANLKGSLALMQDGTMTTRTGGKDTTRESMAHAAQSIDRLEDSLARHRQNKLNAGQ